MKVLIVGATGGLGMESLRRAPERGHEATALARDPSTVQGQDERLRAVRGDVLDPASVESAVRGQDAVLSALGTPNPGKPSTLLSEGTKNLVDAMKRNGVERLVCVTILGTGDGGRRHGRLFYKLFVLGYFVKPMLEDKEPQEVVMRQSGLEWTIVRPPRYTDEPESGNYRVITDSGGRIGKIGRKDLAGFMLDQLDDTSHVRRASRSATEPAADTPNEGTEERRQ